MAGLPKDMIENILTRLPVKSIARFRCVSKSWLRHFKSPNFIKNHLNHANLMNKFTVLVSSDVDVDGPYLFTVDNNVVLPPFLGHALTIDYPFMCQGFVPAIHGTSNGLVCIEPFRESSMICIWNPATREYTRVLRTSFRYPRGHKMLYGFGFDCKDEDYKLLGIVAFEGCAVSAASVYSLRSNSWKELGFIPYDSSFSKTAGLLLNGVVHWLVRHGELKSGVTLCFDISEEKFYHVPLPNNNSVEDPFLSQLGIWEGKLCLLHGNQMEDPKTCKNIDVWTMMDNKWSKHLKISAHTAKLYHGRPIQTSQNGEILFESVPMEGHGVVLMSYDPKLDRARPLTIHGFPHQSDCQTYIETLIPLNSGTYVGQE